ELIDYAKKNPDQLSLGASGTAATTHFSPEPFRSMAYAHMRHIAHKVARQAGSDLASGHIAEMFSLHEPGTLHVQMRRQTPPAVTAASRAGPDNRRPRTCTPRRGSES